MKKNSIIDKYINKVEELLQTLPPLEERFEIIESLNAEYLSEVGENLPSFILEMLGTWYMKEIYSDKRTNKSMVEEFPVLSEHQIYRRDRKLTLIEDEGSLSILDFHLKNNSRNSSTSKRDTYMSNTGGTYNE